MTPYYSHNGIHLYLDVMLYKMYEGILLTFCALFEHFLSIFFALRFRFLCIFRFQVFSRFSLFKNLQLNGKVDCLELQFFYSFFIYFLWHFMSFMVFMFVLWFALLFYLFCCVVDVILLWIFVGKKQPKNITLKRATKLLRTFFVKVNLDLRVWY